MTDQGSQSTFELFDRYVIPTYARFPLEIVRGAGCRVWDQTGRQYLDFGSGIAVCSLGHSHPKLAEALSRQAHTLIHTSNLYYTRLQGLLAQRLVSCVGAPGKVFFCNSGAEANEALFKLARKFGNEGAPPPPRHTVGEWVEADAPRYEVMTFLHSFHGRSLAGIAATGQEKVKKGFEPEVRGFVHVPFNDSAAVTAAITPQTAAILVEAVQGESGIRSTTAGFLRHLRQICDEYHLLLMFDEVQCGLGRTGDWCGWKTIAGSDVMPDAVSWAKGIAGGFPMGAIWVADRPLALRSGGTASLANLLGPGSHGTTFGGTPLASAAGLAVLDVIEEEGLMQNAVVLGAHALKMLAEIRSPLIREIRGVGLLIGIELQEDFIERVPSLSGDKRSPAIVLVELLQKAGLLSIPAGPQVVRWLPPLNVTREEVDQAIAILKTTIESLA